MIQQFQSTNYMTPSVFYNKFLFWLVRLQPFINETGRPPMNADSFVRLFRILYGCGLRVTEGISLEKRDIDLNHRLLTIRKPKTGHKKKFRTDGTVVDNVQSQRTTILPYDIPMLEKHLDQLSSHDKLFGSGKIVAHGVHFSHCQKSAHQNTFLAMANPAAKIIITGNPNVIVLLKPPRADFITFFESLSRVCTLSVASPSFKVFCACGLFLIIGTCSSCVTVSFIAKLATDVAYNIPPAVTIITKIANIVLPSIIVQTIIVFPTYKDSTDYYFDTNLGLKVV